MKKFFRVVAQTEAVSVMKQDGTSILKSTIVLQEPGGRYENSYAVTLLGNLAACSFTPGSLVFACLRFQAKDYHPKVNGVVDQGKTEYLMDIMAQEMCLISN